MSVLSLFRSSRESSLVAAGPYHKYDDTLVASFFRNAIYSWYLCGPLIFLDAIFVEVMLVAEADEGSIGNT